MDQQLGGGPRAVEGRRWRRWLSPVTAVAAFLYFLIDALVLTLVRPVASRLARLRLFARLGQWVRGLGPYPTLALFLVPIVVLEPLKPLGLYLIGAGHAVQGVAVIAVAEVLKVATVERLFHISRDKLMSIPAFARVYGVFAAILARLKALPAWQAVARRLGRLRAEARRIAGLVRRTFR